MAFVHRKCIWVVMLLVTCVVGMHLRGDNIDTEKLSPPASSQEGVLAYTYPTRVYKTRDAGNVKLESWYFYLIVEDKRGRTLEPVTLSLEFCSQGKTMQKELLSAAALATITSQSFKVTDKTPVISVRRVMGLDESFDLRLLHSKPESWQIDLVKATLTVRDPEGQEFSVVKEVPLSHYQQRNQLIFPFRGTAIVTQGPFNNRGHYGPSNHFAIDVIGLTPTYSPPWSLKRTAMTPTQAGAVKLLLLAMESLFMRETMFQTTPSPETPYRPTYWRSCRTLLSPYRGISL